MIYDLAIIGGGPAGATAGFLAAKEGFNVVIIEREKLPRQKPCGGGLTYKVGSLLKEIGVDIDELPIERTFTSVVVCGHGEGIEVKLSPWVIKTVRRDIFDMELVRLANGQGAKIMEATTALSASPSGEGIKVVTRSGGVVCRKLLIAEGANVLISRKLGLRSSWRKEDIVFAMEGHARGNFNELKFIMDAVPHGYGWIFPGRGYASFGVGCMGYLAQKVKPAFQELVRKNRAELTRWGAAILPLGGKERPLSRGDVYLLGDSAGLIDPLTGEGIYQAMRSAVEAVRSIADGDPYEERMRPLLEDLALRRRAASLVLPRMKFFYRLMVGSDEIARRFAEACSGMRTFKDFWRWALRRIPIGALKMILGSRRARS